MTKRIKLIWDFYGEDSLQIAKHHAIHLREFSANNALNNSESGEETVKDNHNMAFMIVDESEMIKVRDALKPHRGEWV